MPGAANIYKMRKAAKDKDELKAEKKKPKKRLTRADMYKKRKAQNEEKRTTKTISRADLLK